MTNVYKSVTLIVSRVEGVSVDKKIRSFEWFIIDEFYGNNGIFTYVLVRVIYDMDKLLNGEFIAKRVDYFLARCLAPNIYIAYEALCPVFDNLSMIEELGCPIDERGNVYVSAKAQEHKAG